MSSYDAILLLSFGGPEGPDDVIPFLENVLRGRNVPHERLVEVSHHYMEFGGVSPINQQCRELKVALEEELRASGIDLPVYWGNRNWTPYLTDVVSQMKDDGVKRFLTFVTSTYSCYSGCRQYRENLAAALEPLGDDAPVPDKIRVYYNHPNWIEVNAGAVRAGLEKIPEERRAAARIAFTAHSIPNGMADKCRYVQQLTEACRLVGESLGAPFDGQWDLVYQSRSGPPHQPWLEPDICDHLDAVKAEGVADVVCHPIGFISDHMEILFDLDTEAKEHAEEIGLGYVRSASAGTHPLFIQMIRELIQERMDATVPKRACGQFGPNHDVCPATCCQSGRPGPGKPAAAQQPA